MKRLGLLGTFVWDTVWTLADQARGRPFETWGGVGYSLAAAAAALPAGWEIVPIAKVGLDLVGRAHELLDTLPGIGRRDGVTPVDQPNNRVELVYTDHAERGEKMSGGVPGWTWPELAPHAEGLEALYVNFFSGWEMDVATARRAGGLAIPTYADLHSLFLGPPRADGPRLYRALPDRADWVSAFRALQLNEIEYELLTGDRLGPDECPNLLQRGPGAVFVTLGAEGAAYAVDPQFPAPRGVQTGASLGRVPACPVPPNADPTGCGDSWGITNFLGLLEGRSPEDAISRANRLAATKMRHRGATGLYEHLDRERARWGAPPAAG